MLFGGPHDGKIIEVMQLLPQITVATPSKQSHTDPRNVWTNEVYRRDGRHRVDGKGCPIYTWHHSDQHG